MEKTASISQQDKGDQTMEYSYHATVRAKQRSISNDTIEYVLYFGSVFHKAGALIYFLRDSDIPACDRANPTIAKMAGTAVVLAPKDRSVITVWKDRENGLRNIKRMPNFSTRAFPRLSAHA